LLLIVAAVALASSRCGACRVPWVISWRAWIASGSIVSMLAYYVLDDHVDLYPWNNHITSQLASTLAALLPLCLYAVAFALDVCGLMVAVPCTAMSGWHCRYVSGGFHTCSDYLPCTGTSGGMRTRI